MKVQVCFFQEKKERKERRKREKKKGKEEERKSQKADKFDFLPQGKETKSSEKVRQKHREREKRKERERRGKRERERGKKIEFFVCPFKWKEEEFFPEVTSSSLLLLSLSFSLLDSEKRREIERRYKEKERKRERKEKKRTGREKENGKKESGWLIHSSKGWIKIEF